VGFLLNNIGFMGGFLDYFDNIKGITRICFTSANSQQLDVAQGENIVLAVYWGFIE